MNRLYKNSPIDEAVCEFRVTPDTPWDIAVPGLFYDKVKGTFANREQRLFQEVELTQGPQSIQHQVRTSERIMLFTDDRKKLVQLGPRFMSVNVLRPYPSWNAFRALIELAWKGLQEAVGVTGLERIGLRYVNRVELPGEVVNVEEYFEFYPFVGKSLPQKLTSFFIRAEFPFSEGQDCCRVQLTRFPNSTEGKTSIILDLDYFLAKPRAVDVVQALDWVEVAHTRVEEMFEGCIRDPLRKLFEEVK
ncbi:MAG: TIGR04255 family protein [Thermogutta sp.]